MKDIDWMLPIEHERATFKKHAEFIDFVKENDFHAIKDKYPGFSDEFIHFIKGTILVIIVNFANVMTYMMLNV